MACIKWLAPEKVKKKIKAKKLLSSALMPQLIKYTSRAITAYESMAIADCFW
mgnify:CR=1 FL=1